MDAMPTDPRIDASRSWPCSPMWDAEITGRPAWRRGDIAEADWKLPVPAAALAEIAALIADLRANPVPTLLVDAADLALPACRAMMAGVKAVLDEGVGFAILDRLPTDIYSKEELTAVYWVLSQLIARPVAQAYKGTMLYDVWDTGQKTSTRVRADLTNEDLSWHSDYGFNHPPPYLGLLVLRTALEGGESSVGSLLSAHNVLRQRHPELLQRLYEPFVWNRQGEHPEDAPICTANPIFSAASGEVRARFNKFLQPVGYRLVDREIDELGMAALNALHAVMSEPDMHVDFVLEAGQIEYVNNARMVHQRTGFTDHDDPALRRHLVRIFLRDEGRRSYMG